METNRYAEQAINNENKRQKLMKLGLLLTAMK